MNVMESIKSITEIVRKIDNLELYRQILDLQSETMKLMEEKNELQQRVKELEGERRTQESLTFDQDAYWRQLSGGKKDGPFCSNCWDVKRTLVRLHFMGNVEYSQCPSCKKDVEVNRGRSNPFIPPTQQDDSFGF